MRDNASVRELLQREVAVFEYDTVGSTNTVAREYALAGGRTPALIVARHQTDGRGRLGRSFYSPADTGLYMSILIDVTKDAPTSALSLTTVAALASALAVEECTGVKVGIKWVNDLYVADKKVCGILCESFLAGDKRYAVIGIGINLCTFDFPSELVGIAASLGVSDAPAVRDELAARICMGVLDFYGRVRGGDTSYIIEYKRRSAVLRRAVRYTVGDRSGEGIAEDITDDGALVVRLDDGNTELLGSGEISLRIRKEDEK